ncbi:MAG: flavin monoamine oxidase family protein [Ardenticatenaceae bacterium]
MMSDKNHASRAPTDVIIVGAGLAGLTAARQLARQGVSVQVLEACDHVGGRMFDYQSKFGYIFQLGAEWLGPDEEQLNALLTELGLETTPLYQAGDVIIRLEGEVTRFDGNQTIAAGPLPLPPKDLSDDLLLALERLDTFCEQVPLDHPHEAPKATEWDAISVAEWCQQHISTKRGQALFSLIAEIEMGVSLDQLSFLYHLFMWRSINRQMIDDRRVKGGVQQICQLLAESLATRVQVGAAVRAIQQDEKGVMVQSDAGRFSADYVIVTAPPKPALEITYQPALPEERTDLLSSLTLAQMVKCVIVYDRPFWREAGLGGFMMSDEGPIKVLDDCSPVNGSHGALVGFTRSSTTGKWSQMSQQARRAAILEQLTEFFGPQAAQPLEYIDQDWVSFPWAGGAYFPNMPPGVMTTSGQLLRKPVGRIHWAGTETATLWTGSMEGAIRSGERAATEVLTRLQRNL